jgi:DNA polymerase-3 subunit epsilon
LLISLSFLYEDLYPNDSVENDKRICVRERFTSANFQFCAIDFETTGSVAGFPVEPWQIGVVVCRGEQEPFFWESLLKVGPRPFHPRAPGRHAAIRAELERSPTLMECLPELRKHCVGIPLVAHNIGTEQKCLRQGVPMEKFGPWIDTLKLSRAAWPDLPSHTLGDLLERFRLSEEIEKQLPNRGTHDALYDACGSAVLLRYLLHQPGWAEVSLEVLVHPDVSGYYGKR